MKLTVALGGFRQLYQARVTPVAEYASTVWHNTLKDKTHLLLLSTVQRNALIRILSAFGTVATSTLDVETTVLPTRVHLLAPRTEYHYEALRPPA